MKAVMEDDVEEADMDVEVEDAVGIVSMTGAM